jgi:D-alanyl-D-alanine carboxypeptidase
VTNTAVRGTPVARQLEKIEQRWGSAKPSVCVYSRDGEKLLDWSLSPLPAPLTGVTKLLTLAMILREFDRGAFSPETPIADLLSPNIVEGLCVYEGSDLSPTVTVQNLLSHQSGIPDYYRSTARGTISFMTQSLSRDRTWTLDQALEIAKHYPAKFAPGTPRKVEYSDTNYQLLGAILTQSTGMSYEQLIKLRVVSPLGLKTLSVFTSADFENYFSIIPVKSGERALRNPQTLASFGPSGSVVSTARDAVRFMQAFWGGELCELSWLQWCGTNQRRLAPGVSMGMGMMKSPMPGRKRYLLGHSGSSGTALMVDTQTDNVGFIALNTISTHSVAIKILGRLMATFN